MTLHDAALESFAQWWRRQVRGGHAYAEAAYLERSDPAGRRRLLSIALFGGALPAAALAGVPFTGGASLLLLAAHGLLWVRVWRASRRRGRSRGDAARYATALAVGKVAEFQGAVRFAWSRWRWGRAGTLIEYKGPGRG
jgi:hypothetical protein